MTDQSTARAGFFYALSAYSLWGLMPLYWKLLSFVSPLEILAHRAIWSVPTAILVVLFVGRTHQLWPTFKSFKLMFTLFVCAILVSINWGVFVWAIAVDRVLDAAMAYYINPLMTVALGFFFLGDRFNKLQGVAIALAAAAVLLLTVVGGSFPWIAILLAFTFAVYGYLRKTVDVGPNQGFLIESLIMFIPALIYIVWLQQTSDLVFGSLDWTSLLLILAGPATAIPLILFANGAKRLRLSTIGLMQYMVPTILFFMAVFLYSEPLDHVKLAAFVLIWLALAIYAYTLLNPQKK